MISDTKKLSSLKKSDSNYIKLVSHACIFIKLGDIHLITDPWLFGDVFNNGWSLQLKKNLDELLTLKEINSITHIWLSHEHPDHFHIPSLKYLSEKIKNQSAVKILMKRDPRTNKTIKPILNKFGFEKVILLKHLEKLFLNQELELSIYHHRHIDSALLLKYKSQPLILNINDSELDIYDCNLIKKKFGSFKILINQFSLAGYDGIINSKSLEKQKFNILKKMTNQHKTIEAKVTIPFASFMWFSRADNKHLNKWHNSLQDVYVHFKNQGLNCFCIEPPSEKFLLEDILKGSKKPKLNLKNIAHEKVNEKINIDKYDLAKLINKRLNELKTFSNSLLFRFVEKNLFIYVKDKGWLLEITNKNKLSCHIANESIKTINRKMITNLQPIHFAFINSFGIQTLGVSGRYKFEGFNKVPKLWRLIRILSSLENNQTPLRFRTLLRLEIYKLIIDRKGTLPNQIVQQIKRFFFRTNTN